MPKKAANGRIVFSIFFLLLIASCGGHPEEEKRDPSVLHVSTVEAEDGVQIAYQIKGDGYPVIILIHGWACNRQYWDAQFERLAEHYTVVSIDLAGHGDSGDEREQFTMQSFASDVRAVIEKEGLRFFILAGHSMGGAVALETACQIPDRVLGLIGVEAFHDITVHREATIVDSVLAALRTDFVTASRAWVRKLFTGRSDPALVDHIVKDISRVNARVAINVFRQYSWYHHEAGFQEVGLPVYLLNSDRWPTNLAPLRRLSPHAAMTTMPGLGHFVMLEDPDLFMINFTTAINYIRTHPVDS